MKCNASYGIDEVANLLTPGPAPGDIGPDDRAHCSECDSWEVDGGTVVRCGERGGYICLSCFEEFAALYSCGFCGGFMTGEDEEATYAFGCALCEGARNWSDRD